MSDDTILTFFYLVAMVLAFYCHIDQQARVKEILHVSVGFCKKIFTSDLSQRLNHTTQ